MDKGMKVLVGLGVLGLAWYWFSKDKTPGQRLKEVASTDPYLRTQTGVDYNAGDQGPPLPEWYQNVGPPAPSQYVTTPDYEVLGDYGPPLSAYNPVAGSTNP